MYDVVALPLVSDYQSDGATLEKNDATREISPWAKACMAGGVPGKLFHDLRRTAIRNMIRGGADQKTVMMITGHKTTSVFLRYQIAKAICAHTSREYVDGHMPMADGHFKFRKALQFEAAALAEYTHALTVFTDLTMHGKMPSASMPSR